MIIVGDFNTPLSPMARSCREGKCQQINIRVSLYYGDFTEIYRAYHSITAENVLLIDTWKIL
jgi:hypothetical protein